MPRRWTEDLDQPQDADARAGKLAPAATCATVRCGNPAAPNILFPQRGEDIVKAWLLADPGRTFLLIYSTRSVGWSEYVALQHTEVAARVKVCAVDKPHLLVPTVPDVHDALVDPDGWDNGTCHWGT